MRFLIFIFLAFAKTQRHSITWFEHLSVCHLISITLCAWIALRGNMCTLCEHKQVLYYYRQWNNEHFLNTFSAFSYCKYKCCQRRKDVLVTVLLLGNHYGSVIKSSLESIGFDITIKSKNESFSWTFLDINVSLKLADLHSWFLMSVYICSIFRDAFINL